jgi:cell division protein FtsW (lipid II flippase)
MRKTVFKDVLIGSIAALLCAGIIIFTIEYQKSFLQLLVGFVLFIFPFTFLPLYKNKVGSFILVFTTTLITYIVSKYMYHDFWLGVILAAIIGGAAFYFRVGKAKPFSPIEYKNKAKFE